MVIFRTVEEIAVMLRLTAGTVREKRKAGAFPNAVKVGRRWLIPTEDVVSYLDSQGSK